MIRSDVGRAVRTALIATVLPRDVSLDDLSEVARESERLPSEGGGRWTSAVVAALGGTLLLLGLRRGSILGTAMAIAGGWLLYRGLGDAVDLSGGIETARTPLAADRGVSEDAVPIERSVTVGKPADELYDLWRDPEALADVVGPVAEVTASDADAESDPTGLADEDADSETEEDAPDRLRWTVEAPFGRRLTWETEVVEDRPGELLRWESLEGAPVPGEMTVRFDPAPADRGTKVTFEVRADPPAGELGHAAMRALDILPETLATVALDRFKSLAETGEIPTTEKNPSARGKGDLV